MYPLWPSRNHHYYACYTPNYAWCVWKWITVETCINGRITIWSIILFMYETTISDKLAGVQSEKCCCLASWDIFIAYSYHVHSDVCVYAYACERLCVCVLCLRWAHNIFTVYTLQCSLSFQCQLTATSEWLWEGVSERANVNSRTAALVYNVKMAFDGQPKLDRKLVNRFKFV